MALANDLFAFFKNSEHRLVGGIEGSDVSYNKGEVIQSQLETFESVRLSYIQKPVGFRNDYEYKIVCNINGERFIFHSPGESIFTRGIIFPFTKSKLNPCP